MKRNVVILVWLVSLTSAFSQTVTLKIGTIYDPLPGIVLDPVTCEAIDNPITGNNLISSLDWYIAYDTQVLYAGEPGTPATLLNIHPGWSFLTNIFADNPGPGWNTIVVIGCPVEIDPGEKFFDIQFTYVEGLTAKPNIIWTSLNSVATNMSNDVGDNYLLTLFDGYVGPYITRIPELHTEKIKIWFENGNISFNAESSGELSLFNLLGQEIMSAPVRQDLNRIPVKDKNTYYIVRVVTDKFALTQKIYVK